MNYFFKTNIPVPNIDYKKIWNIDPTDQSTTPHKFKSYSNFENLWDKNIYDKLNNIDLFPRLIRVFRWKPESVFPWHIDGTKHEQIKFAINWILEGSGVIQWNRYIKLNLSSEYSFGHSLGNIDDPVEIEDSGHGCIVNTGVTHRLFNLNKIHRISVSILFNKSITFEDAVERLRSENLIV